jgi:hypothetical protein
MPDTVAISAGTLVKMSDAALAVWTTIGELLQVGDLVFDAPQVDATRLSSMFREYVSGLSDTPEVQMDIRLKMDDATQDEITGVAKVFNDRSQRNYRIKFLNQVKGVSFLAIPIAHGITGLRPNELLGRRFGLKLTGAPTFADATTW